MTPNPTTPTYTVGQWVRSRPYGARPAVVGEIIEIDRSRYIIRDATKKRWFRLQEELEPLQ